MKIATMTFPNSTSIGASLQMYSLYKVLTDMGNDVDVLNYDPPNLHYRLEKPQPGCLSALKSALKAAAIHMIVPGSSANFKRFESMMTKNPAVPTRSTDDIRNLSLRYDRIFVGSDQVWNYDVTGHDFNFYLDFCDDDTKKVSYAASFGKNDVAEDEKGKIANLLNRFSHISVREERGQEIVNELTGRSAELVLDPTLLIEPSQLRSVAKPYKRKGDYCLFYNIKPSVTLLESATKYAAENGLRLVKVGGRVKEKFQNRYTVEYGVGPQEFLGLVDNAACVFTNSFHGLAISLAFSKNFYMEYSTDTNSRLLNMAEIFKLQDRVVSNGAAPKAEKMDYGYILEKLNEMRGASLRFISGVLDK